jgi:hypothetical protein
MMISVSMPPANGRRRRNTPEHAPVCLTGEYAAPAVDLVQDHRDRGSRDHRRKQPAHPSDQDRENGRHGTVPAVQSDQRGDAGEVEQHPLDAGSKQVHRKEDGSRRRERGQVLRVYAGRGSEDLTALAPHA